MKRIRFLKYIMAICFLIPYTFPFYWMALTSILPERLVTMSINEFSLYRLLPYDQMSIANYIFVLFGKQLGESMSIFSSALINTIILSLSTVGILIPIASISGYALARINFLGRRHVNISMWIFQILPTIGGVFVLYKVFSMLHLIDTHVGLLILFVTHGIPISVILLRNFIFSIPPELEEAAIVDGCSRLQTLYRIILPNARPGIAVAAILSFLITWNNFFTPLVFTNKLFMVQTALNLFAAEYRVFYGQQAAAIMIAMIPSIIFLVLFNKYLMQGMASGALKM